MKKKLKDLTLDEIIKNLCCKKCKDCLLYEELCEKNYGCIADIDEEILEKWVNINEKRRKMSKKEKLFYLVAAAFICLNIALISLLVSGWLKL